MHIVGNTGSRLHMEFNEASIYAFMQQCIELTPHAEHDVNKIAALLVKGRQSHGAVNNVPEHLKAYVATLPKGQKRIGNASAGPHGEMAAVASAPFPVEGSDLYVTDPPCPNCAKGLAASGVRRVFVDHKGFEKDFYERRRAHFEDLSIPIFEHGSVHVYKVFRDKASATATWEEITQNISDDDRPFEDRPVSIEQYEDTLNLATFRKKAFESLQQYPENKSFAAAILEDRVGNFFFTTARPACALGYHHDTNEFPKGEKYSVKMQPLNRIRMEAAKHGYKMVPSFTFSARTPTSRELVDSVSAGLEGITILNLDQCRDPAGIEARKQLEEAGLLEVETLKL